MAKAPATGVTLTAKPASPSALGYAVTFTGAGQGGTGTYEYQVSNGGTVVQAWGATATWTLPASTVLGSYTISVDVRTAGGAASQANASVTQVIATPAPATSATLTPSVTSPQVPGTAVTFTAVGQGGTGP